MGKKNKNEEGLSRRDFLRGGAAGAVTGGILSGGLVAGIPAQAATSETDTPEAEVLGPGALPITLQINGKTLKAELEPRVTLLDALRNHLDLTGSKKVCDRATCGACTVLLDERPVYACTVLAIEAQGREITTIEGLGSSQDLHPIQAAFVEHDAQQCGFCTPGFVVACQSFLQKNPKPTLAQIEAGLGGNLCRCGTYAGIREVLLNAPNAQGGQARG